MILSEKKIGTTHAESRMIANDEISAKALERPAVIQSLKRRT
jgi:hypothetical protein